MLFATENEVLREIRDDIIVLRSPPAVDETFVSREMPKGV
jgi:hypothetical protein